jgi:hypothetical protein
MAIINSVIAGGGSPTPTGKYQLLQRVKDDSNNEIGTVCGYHTDANNQKYAVVCLDAQYRLASGSFLSRSNVSITGLNVYTNGAFWESTDTATSNCDKVLAFANDKGDTSRAVNHCRSKSFVIGGTTYYGQLPNIVELTDIWRNVTAINTADTSAASYPSLVFTLSIMTMSSTQFRNISNKFYYMLINDIGGVNYGDYSFATFVAPVLEIPIQ